MIYEKGSFYTLPIEKEQSKGDYFVFRAERPDGTVDTTTLGKLEFQKREGYVMPSSMLVRVLSTGKNGLPVLGHAIAAYVYELYSGLWSRNGTIECVVSGLPEAGGDGSYRIVDDNGIIYRLAAEAGSLSVGDRVHCRFVRLAPNYFVLERVDEGTRFACHTFGELMELAGVEPRMASLMEALFRTLPGLEAAVAQEAAGNGLWPLTATAAIRNHLDEWYLTARTRRQQHVHRRLMAAVSKVLLYLLEGSTYLNGALRDARQSYRRQLTELVDTLEPYRRAFGLMEQGRADEFVESIFDRLSVSGYLYHPAVQFGALTVIFRAYPEKVSYYLERIFESLFSRELENWQVNPFREAFVEQFEIYIGQARRAVDAMPVAETRAQKAILQTLVVAIAMQRLLAGDKISARNRSLYYRCISLLRPLGSDALLFKAFLSVMRAPINDKPAYSSLREPMMMMTKAAVPVAGGIADNIRGRRTYSGGGMTIGIDSNGIVLGRAGDPVENSFSCEALLPWLAPRLSVPGIKPMSASRKKRLADHHSWWQEVENALTVSVENHTAEEPMRAAAPGDYAYIVVDSVSEGFDNDPLLHCRIVSNDFYEATGTMRRSDIVDYNLRYPSAQSFSGSDGQPLAFYARVTGRDDDGNYRFSLREEVDGYLQRRLNFSETYTAVITGVNIGGYSAISDEGFGLYLDDTSKNLPSGAIVRFRHLNGLKQGAVHGTIVEVVSDMRMRFDKTRAFANLLHAIGEEAAADDDAGSDATDSLYTDSGETLEAADIAELAAIMRFKALDEDNLIIAYDYLRFARLLAIAAGDSALADNLGTHAALLVQFQYYDVNNAMDTAALAALGAQAAGSPLLKTICHRLEIIGSLGDSRANASLVREVEEPVGEMEAALAKIALSYNMLADTGAPSEVLDGIRSQLKARMNMNTESKATKYYGSESKYLEFKTSIVFPAGAPGGEVREAPEEQQAHIMSRIAGLLNASGGKLYLGVSNDGYAVGLHDDFKYFERHKARSGNRYFEIRNTDNLCVFIENLIHDTFGPTVARKIEVSADNDTDKAVVLIDVRESLDPVYIDGKLFVRQSGQSTREYRDRDLAEFVAERARERAEREHLLGIEEKNAEADATAGTDAAAAEEPATEYTVTADGSQETAADAADTDLGSGVAVSRWMPNALHEYDDGYVAPDGYLYFTGENSVEYSRSDLHIDYSDDCRAALAIGHDYADGFLLMGFDEGRVVKVPLDEIYEKGDNTPMAHNADARLQFVGIARKDDVLVCVVADNSDALWRRTIRVADIDSGHIGSVPRKFHDSQVQRSVAWEIADASRAASFADSMADRLSARKVGVALRARLGDDIYRERLDSLVGMCNPHQ